MLTPWEAARRRILPSLKALGLVMAAWAFMSAAFFWEPLLLWQVLHGHLGGDHIDVGAFARGMAVWLVPVFVVEVVGLITDATSAASSYDREKPADKRFKPTEFYMAYSLTAPLRKFYIEDFQHFRKECMERVWMGATALIALTVWAVAYLLALVLMSPDQKHLAVSPMHLLWGFGAATLTAWVAAAFVVTAFTGSSMFDSHGSILSLPWRQGWARLYALVVLPMAPFYGVAAVRLAVAPVMPG